MENSAKALIMAGAILVAVILISISIVVLNSTSDAREQANSKVNSTEVQSFNNQFSSFTGGLVNASQVKSLILLINANNAHYGFDKNTKAGEDKYIQVSGPTALYPNRTYTVKMTEFTESGYVSKITIELNK